MQLQKRLHKLCCSYRDGNIAVDAFLLEIEHFDWLRHSDVTDLLQLTTLV